MRYYYVSAIDGKRISLMAGPFYTNEEAIFLVDAARVKASEIYGYSHFWWWGTMSYETDKPKAGTMNRHFPSIFK